jgi:hypothetical protein
METHKWTTSDEFWGNLESKIMVAIKHFVSIFKFFPLTSTSLHSTENSEICRFVRADKRSVYDYHISDLSPGESVRNLNFNDYFFIFIFILYFYIFIFLYFFSSFAGKRVGLGHFQQWIITL